MNSVPGVKLSYGIRSVKLGEFTCTFYDNETLSLCKFHPDRLFSFDFQNLPWFDPTNYTDQQIIDRIRNLLVFL